MPSSYTSFFASSTQASAALIGLLFVSVSVAPRSAFRAEGSAEYQLLALSAFAALANVFFLSFSSQLPTPHVGTAAIVLGALTLSGTLGLLVPVWRQERHVLRGAAIFLISAAVYCYEVVLGVELLRHPADLGALSQLLILLIGAFALGLLRAWQLLGAGKEGGIRSQLRSLFGRGSQSTATAQPEAEDVTAERGDAGEAVTLGRQPR